MIIAAFAGTCAGVGLIIVIIALRPAPPRLDAIFAVLDGTAQQASAGRRTADQVIGGWLATRLARPAGRLAVPRQDLALLNRTIERFMTAKLITALTGLTAFALAGVALPAIGLRMPWPVPAVFSLAAAVLLFWFPDIDIRAEAARRRADFRHAFTAYLQLVRLARAGGAGSTEALEYAAHLGHGWVFARIAAVLDHARRAHEPPWEALSALGSEIGIAELADLASITEIAGSEGARVGDTLKAATESLRRRDLAASHATANSRTTTMVVPLTLLGLGVVLLIAFPAFYTLLTAT